MDNQRLINLVNGENQDKKSKYSLLIYVILPLTLAAAVLFYNLDNPFSRRKAQQALDNYIASEYTTELDIFQKQDSLATISEGGLLGNKIVAYSYYFTQPEKGWGGFTISADTDGNIVYDGYKQWYLTGGTVYQRFNDEYTGSTYNLQKQLYALGIENEIFSMLDELELSAYIEHNETYDGYGPVMVYPVLDPNEEYDVNRLAKEYGHISVYLKTATDGTEDYLKYAQFIRDWLVTTDTAYNEITIFMRPAVIKNVRNIHAVFNAEEINSSDFADILQQKMTVYTPEQYTLDMAAVAETPDHWPEEYMLDVDVQFGHERF